MLAQHARLPTKVPYSLKRTNFRAAKAGPGLSSSLQCRVIAKTAKASPVGKHAICPIRSMQRRWALLALAMTFTSAAITVGLQGCAFAPPLYTPLRHTPLSLPLSPSFSLSTHVCVSASLWLS